jgi:DNA-binding protein HU-beta
LTQADVSRALDAIVETVKATARGGDTVTLVGFGSFKQRKRAARTGRNPRTNKAIQIPASSSLAFRASKKALG